MNNQLIRMQRLAGLITEGEEKSLNKNNRLNENAVYTATYDNDFGTFIDDLAHVVGSDNNVEMGPVPITLTPNQFNAWDEFGYDKYWNHIPDGQPFKITGDTEGLAAHPSLKNYTFVKNGNVIKGDPNG